MKRFRFSPLVLRPALAIALIIAAALPATAQTPEERRLPQRDAPRGPAPGLRHPRGVHVLDELPGPAVLQQPRLLRPGEADGEHGHHRGRPRRAVVVAGQLQEPRLLSPEGRQVARRQAVHVEGRQVHLRHAPRGAGRAGQAPHQPAQGLVREHRAHRGGRSVHGGVPHEAPAARAPDDARLGLHPGLCGPYPARAIPHELHRHRPVQAQGVAPRRVRRVREEPRLLRQGPAVSRRAQVRGDRRARHPDGGAPGRAARYRLPRRDVEDDDGPAQEGRAPDGVPHGRAGRHRQHHHERQEGALRQSEGAAGGELCHRPPGPDPGLAPGGRDPRRRDAAPALRRLGRERQGPAHHARLRQGRRDEGPRQEAPRRGRDHPGQAAQGRDGRRAPSRSTSTWPPTSSTS